MKKLLIILFTAIAVAACLSSCESRYEYNYSLQYTIEGQTYTDSGTITTSYIKSVPIAVTNHGGITVDTYPDRAVNPKKPMKLDPRVIYNGDKTPTIDKFEYSLARFYEINIITKKTRNEVIVAQPNIKEE